LSGPRKQSRPRGFRIPDPRTHFDAGLGNLLCLRDGPLHHRLKGDLGVPALKACQHILHHCLRQGVALYLQLVVADFLQLQHLGSCGVKKWESGADLLHWIPGVEGTEVEGRECSLGLAQEVLDFLCLGLAQEVPDILCLASPGCLELF
jgi:hypothetical protein